MINYALEHEAEAAAWDIWVAVYPGFTQETFIPFSEFKDQRIKIEAPKEIKSNDEITKEIGELVAQFEERKRGANK